MWKVNHLTTYQFRISRCCSLDSASLHPGYELRAASYRSVRDEELIGGKG